MEGLIYGIYSLEGGDLFLPGIVVDVLLQRSGPAKILILFMSASELFTRKDRAPVVVL